MSAPALAALREAFGLEDGHTVAVAWRQAFLANPALAAQLRAVADAPAPFSEGGGLDPLTLAHHAGMRDLALVLLDTMHADALTLAEIFTHHEGHTDHDPRTDRYRHPDDAHT